MFASYSPHFRWPRLDGERRTSQRALILSSLANSGAETKRLSRPQEAEMSLSTTYCDFVPSLTKPLCIGLIYKAALSGIMGVMKKHGAETCQAERSNSLKHLSEDELLDLFETARRLSARDHALLIVCFQHALRASELISLRLGDIDWRNMELTIQRLKGSLKTTQPLFRMRGRPCMDEVSALRRWLKQRPNDWGSDFLFVSQKGRFNRNTVSRIFAKYCRLASEARVTRGETPIGESCWHIHALKHSRITSVVGKMDLYLVKLLARHAALSSTLKYAHGSQKLACDKAQRVSIEAFS
jgi:integrase